jgi:hypothetical protein
LQDGFDILTAAWTQSSCGLAKNAMEAETAKVK